MARYAILAEGAFNYILNKTGNMLLRYFPEEVVAVIDSKKVGRLVQDVVGCGVNTPVVRNFSKAKEYHPDTLVLGNAPQGGKMNSHYRNEIIAAIKSGCNIISGMHNFLNDDPQISQLARENNCKLTDLRRPPEPPHFPRGTWKTRQVPVILIVGSDCDTGKMTTAWEITIRLRERDLKINFIGTGQTGILLSGNGVPIDAVLGDFMAGEIEYAIDNVNSNADVIIIEGQGSITNMLYSGVTLGLLHGSMPDYLVMTHEPTREYDVTDYPMLDIRQTMQLYLNLMKPFKKAEFLGINLMTFKQTESSALEDLEKYEKLLGIPATDLIRFGSGRLINHIEQQIRAWN